MVKWRQYLRGLISDAIKWNEDEKWIDTACYDIGVIEILRLTYKQLVGLSLSY